MFSEKFSEDINNIVKQFLCNTPVKNIVWNNILQKLSYELQETLANKTVNSNLVLNYPLEINYQKAFLKCLIEKLEKQCSEVHDELYSAYGRLVALPPANEYFKHYLIENSGNIISLKENINLISDGTTGLRTWQAALALSEWSLSNMETLKNKVILELGSGVGLTGLTIAKECQPTCVYLTDCHTSVLKTLCDNLRLNTDKNTRIDDNSVNDSTQFLQDRCVYQSLGQPNVFVLNLPWEDVSKESCTKLGTINKVIAADVVYDCELFDPLITALKCLASFCSVGEFIFACTERNRKTLDDFLRRIREACFSDEELLVPSQKNFMWPTDTPIRLFRFMKKQLQ